MKEFYTTKEVAELTGLKDNSIRKYISLGQLKAEKIGRTSIIYKADLDEWLSKRYQKRKLSNVLAEIAEDNSLTVEERTAKIGEVLKQREDSNE